MVSLEARTDGSGNVVDARVLSGPDELRRAAISSVLQWHFTPGPAGAAHMVNITFQLPTDQRATQPASPNAEAAHVQLREMAQELNVQRLNAQPTPPRTVSRISILGLSDSVRDELMPKLVLHVGDTLAPGTLEKISGIVRDFDEHLRVTLAPVGENQAALVISAPEAKPEAPQAIRVGPRVMQAKLVQQARPIYPPEAKAARIQGTVQLAATIGPDGTMQHLEVISGHPLLVPAAMEAVRQWVYEPTLLNGNPVAVQTSIDVNFTLAQ
jgi:TonB family protein